MPTRRHSRMILGRCCGTAAAAVIGATGFAAPTEPAVKPMDPKATSLAAPPPPSPPGDPSADKPRSIIPSPSVVTPGQTLPLDPVRPNVPGLPSVEVGYPSNPSLLREGAFVSNARGRVVKGKSGWWFIVFDPDTSGHTLPPMILLQNANLASIERLLERSPAETRVRVSGQVTVYRDRDFFIVTVPPLLERAQETTSTPTNPPPTPTPPAPAAQPVKAEANAPAAATPNASEPSMDQIIADLDKVVGAKRDSASSRASAQPAAHPAEAPPTPNAEAATSDGRLTGYLVDRRGRLVRSTDGSLMFRADSGSGGRTEPAYTLLPCQNLTSLEGWSDAAGDGTPVTLNGEVFSYHGREYLLPAMYTVPKQSDQVLPTQ